MEFLSLCATFDALRERATCDVERGREVTDDRLVRIAQGRLVWDGMGVDMDIERCFGCFG
jgi:hypothetical protein